MLKFKKIFHLKKVEKLLVEMPTVKNLNTLTSVEVFALAHAELGLELFPLHLYRGVVRGNFIHKGIVPLMEKVKKILYQDCYGNLDSLYSSDTLTREYQNRGYITPEEKEKIEAGGYKVRSEKIPALFIIAPVETKIKIIEVPDDPIILIKLNENEWIPVHSWNHSFMLSAKLAELN